MDKGIEVRDFLNRWDAGDPVWTLEMGGLGPGYEQAIQVAAVEMARDCIGIVLPEDKEAAQSEWDRLCTASLREHDEALGGLSGAQYSAARWLAWNWVHGGGPEALLKRADENGAGDRKILVSNSFPRAALRTATGNATGKGE